MLFRSDAIYAGRKVLTVAGTSFASRVATSVLKHQDESYQGVESLEALKAQVIAQLNTSTPNGHDPMAYTSYEPRVPQWSFSDLILSAQK